MVVTTAPKDRLRDDADRAAGRDGGRRDDQREQTPSTAHQPSIMMNVMITGAVALVCGVLGAMAYSHFAGPKPGEPSKSQAKTDAGSDQKSSVNGKSGGEPKTDSTKRPSAQASTPASNSELNSIPGGGRLEATDHCSQS